MIVLSINQTRIFQNNSINLFIYMLCNCVRRRMVLIVTSIIRLIGRDADKRFVLRRNKSRSSIVTRNEYYINLETLQIYPKYFGNIFMDTHFFTTCHFIARNLLYCLRAAKRPRAKQSNLRYKHWAFLAFNIHTNHSID